MSGAMGQRQRPLLLRRPHAVAARRRRRRHPQPARRPLPLPCTVTRAPRHANLLHRYRRWRSASVRGSLCSGQQAAVTALGQHLTLLKNNIYRVAGRDSKVRPRLASLNG